MLRRRKGPSQFPGGRKDAGTSCLPRVSPSSSPHPLPIPSIPASDPSRCFWVRTILPTASLLPLFTCTPPGTVGVTTSPGSFCFGGNHWWFPLLDCRHSVCFLLVSSGHREWAMFLGAALCGVSPPTAERLPCCNASPCRHLPPQRLRVGNRTSGWSPASKCWHMLTLHSPIVEDGIEQWE